MTRKDDQPSNNPSFRQDLDAGHDDLSNYLSELQEAEGGAPSPEPAPDQPASGQSREEEPAQAPPPAADPPPPSSAMSRYDELRRARGVSMEKNDLSIYTDFSTVIGKIHAAQQTIEELRKDFPETFPERSYDTWIGNLKETQMIMMREFHSLRNGRKEKKYDKRCVCVKCHTVFMFPLPDDGICDECRAATPAPGQAAEGGGE